jgi:hypothetical protein
MKEAWMYCPKCSAEYREGFTECASCGVSLVNELPPEAEPDYIKFITVYEGGDPGFIAFAKSILDSEGIKYFFKGEGVQELFAGGRLGAGFNPLVGPIEIQVDENDAEYARELLKQIEESEFEGSGNHVDGTGSAISEAESTYAKSDIGTTNLIKGLLIGALISGALCYLCSRKHN